MLTEIGVYVGSGLLLLALGLAGGYLMKRMNRRDVYQRGLDQGYLRGHQAAVDEGWTNLWTKQAEHEALISEYRLVSERLRRETTWQKGSQTWNG